MNDDSLELLELSSSGTLPATASVIVLHGLGADGEDFVPVVQALDLERLGSVRFVLPSAPVRPVTINGGYRMRAWYDIHPVPADPAKPRTEDEAGLMASRALVQQLIDREVDRGVPSTRIVLMGFSQGCALTLLAGLLAPARLAGLAGLSGYLPMAGQAKVDQIGHQRSMPVFLAHGEHDDIVTPDRGLAARDALLSLGVSVDWHSYPMGHEVCMPEIEDLNRWLFRVLG
ncbi:MAG TPA: carboxylesterase [Hydrogenophaga sp.]|uniref:alpha/beta hydrolase n=1 Tax=Hydrogenophaga sp. TaxID=1904254 RepID=UPI002B8135FC|nr:carboxylesterase [Hydrogenophaga sp.]HMN93538.1 carboxylesterase [Hydrogenophaga sp.]HMP10253.1 carboxylesterase [Hydrogenophaga sp.]